MYGPGAGYHSAFPFLFSLFFSLLFSLSFSLTCPHLSHTHTLTHNHTHTLAVFAGKDASRGLAKTSTAPADALPAWRDLAPNEIDTLNGWVSFFRQRYNQVGVVEGADNLDDDVPE